MLGALSVSLVAFPFPSLWHWSSSQPALVETAPSGGCEEGCSGHGICREAACHCDTGWEGATCELSTCPSMCHGHGQCTAGVCVCHAGYTGEACDRGAEPTCPSHCSGNGWCVPGWQAESYRRLHGNSSAVTSVEQNAGSKPAPEDAAAQAVGGHAVVCVCTRGWRGAACDFDTCPDHCEGRGRCSGGACICSEGWKGTSCGEPMVYPPPPSPPPPPWECPTAYSCSGNGVCELGACSCRAGFKGEQCQEVAGACPGGCSGHGRCDAARGVCVCSLGYVGQDCGRSACAEPDDESPHGCHGRGHCECSRERHSCECQCQVGFAPPMCANTTCPADCHSPLGQGVCVRGKCQCSAGWRGSDCGVDVCPLGCSSPNGQCVDGDCVCKAGWRGRDCAMSTCPGTGGDGRACSGHGRCDVNHLLEVRCVCDAGYKGVDCAMAKNSSVGRTDCAARICTDEAHGSCANDDSGPCLCNPGWAGTHCERLLCPGSCSGNGFCTDAGCRCYQGWRGETCDIPICPGDCSGHGRCVRGACQCDAGWADKDCALAARQRAAPPVP